MVTLEVQTENEEQLAAVEAVLKVLKVRFTKQQPAYNPEYVDSIRESQAQVEAGSFIRLKKSDIANLFRD